MAGRNTSHQGLCWRLSSDGREYDDWDRIFRLVYEDGTEPRFVQACFGELKWSQIVSVKVFGKR